MAYKKIYCIVEQRKYTKHDKGIARKEITESVAKKIATRLLEKYLINDSSYDVKFDMIEPDVNSKPQRLSSLKIQNTLFDTFKKNADMPKELLDADVGLEDVKLYQQTLGSKAFYENKEITRKVSDLLRNARKLSKYDVISHDIFVISVFRACSSIYSPQHLQEKIDDVEKAKTSWVVTYEADY